jgi:hypothetical protein
MKKRRQKQKATKAKALAKKAAKVAPSSFASDESDKSPQKLESNAGTSEQVRSKPTNPTKTPHETDRKSKISSHISTTKKARVKSVSTQPKKRQKLS